MATPSSPTLPASSGVSTTNTNPNPITKINIGTRRSQLAIAQVDSIIQQLKSLHLASPEIEYVPHVVSTMADENQVKSFSAFDSKSIWTEELEALLAKGELDVVVHCLKDMPTTLPATCALGIICAREDPRDVVVFPSSTSSPSYTRLQDLPPNSIVGTSSVRRKAQIARRFPHLKCVDVRGNLNTRLRKLDASAEIADGGENGVNVQKYDCLILAAAGLKRIDLGHRISQYLSAEDGVLYAPGQGALGLEIRAGDERMRQFLGVLADGPTTLACGAERSLLKTLQGGCSAPVGVETSWEGERLVLRASVISTDGRECVEASKEGVVGSYEEAEVMGRELAERLLGLGAEGILRGIREGAAQ